MAIKKYYTCKTYLKSVDETKIVARLDSENYNAVITEQDECEFLRPDAPECVNRHIRGRYQKEYLIGEIADRLYAYEQLGYEPEELKRMLEVRNVQRIALNSIYGSLPDSITVGRQHGKTVIQSEFVRYAAADVDVTYSLWSRLSSTISNVIFNDPATIVFWADGTKTVVKAHDEKFDPEKGLAMAIAKKFFGNEGNYFNQIKKWTEKYKPLDINKLLASKCVTVSDDDLPWKIWMTYYDQDGNEIGFGVHPKEYTRKSSAVRRAKQLWGANPACKWTVSQTNPWTKENADDVPEV